MTTRKDNGAIEAARHTVAGKTIERSPEWPAVAKAHLAKEPHCVACKPGTNTKAGLQVHHIFPFHYCVTLGRPDLELDQRNLITLCETEKDKPSDNHHLLIGHLDDFKSSNLNVKDDAKNTFNGMSEIAIKKDKQWLLEEAKKLKPLDEMTQQDKQEFKAKMDKLFPKK